MGIQLTLGCVDSQPQGRAFQLDEVDGVVDRRLRHSEDAVIKVPAIECEP